MTLRQLDDVLVECYFCIFARNKKNKEVTLFDDFVDDELKLKNVLKEFGDCKVIEITAGEEKASIIVTIQAEYVKVD